MRLLWLDHDAFTADEVALSDMICIGDTVEEAASGSTAAAALFATLGAAAVTAGPSGIMRIGPGIDTLSSFVGVPLGKAPL